MFVVCGVDASGPFIAGPPGAGDGGGSSGTALTGPMLNASAATPAAAAAATLALREMFMMFVSSASFKTDIALATLRGTQFAGYPKSGR